MASSPRDLITRINTLPNGALAHRLGIEPWTYTGYEISVSPLSHSGSFSVTRYLEMPFHFKIFWLPFIKPKFDTMGRETGRGKQNTLDLEIIAKVDLDTCLYTVPRERLMEERKSYFTSS